MVINITVIEKWTSARGYTYILIAKEMRQKYQYFLVEKGVLTRALSDRSPIQEINLFHRKTDCANDNFIRLPVSYQTKMAM